MALAFGAALVTTLLPADAMAQGKSDHGGRHDNGQHKGWYKNGKSGHDDDQRRESQWERAQRLRRIEEARRRERSRGQQFRDWNRPGAYRPGADRDRWQNSSNYSGDNRVLSRLGRDEDLTMFGLRSGRYSASQFAADRDARDREARQRYSLFNRRWFDYNGERYVRRTTRQHGQTYYYFQRQR